MVHRRCQEAAVNYQQSLDVPETVYAQMNMGGVHALKGDTTTALRYYKEAHDTASLKEDLKDRIDANIAALETAN